MRGFTPESNQRKVDACVSTSVLLQSASKSRVCMYTDRAAIQSD